MKKLIVIALAGVVFLGAPYYIGNQVEENVKSYIASVNDYPGYTVELSDFQKGWFSSTAKATVSIANLDNQMENTNAQEFNFMTAFEQGIEHDIRINHGLFFLNPLGFGLAQYDVSPVLSQEANQSLKEELNFAFKEEGSQVRLTGGVGISGANHGQLTIPAFTVSMNNEQDQPVFIMDMGKSNANFDYAENEGRLEYVGAIAPMNIEILNESPTQAGNVQFGDITFNGHVVNVQNSKIFWIGKQSANMEKITLNGPNGEKYSIDNIALTTDLKQNEDQSVDMFYEIIGKSVNINDVPETIETITLGLAVNQVSQSLQVAFEEFYSLANDAQVEQTQIQAALTNMGELAKKNPPNVEIRNIEFTFNNGEQFKANGAVNFDADALEQNLPIPLAVDATVNANLTEQFLGDMLIFQNTVSMQQQASSGLQTHDVLRQQAQAMLESQVSNGFLVKNDTGYSATLEMKDGTILLNGEKSPFPIPGFTQ